MPVSEAKIAQMADFEIAVARLYVQHELSTAQIAERMRCNTPKVVRALRDCGFTVDGRRVTWNC